LVVVLVVVHAWLPGSCHQHSRGQQLALHAYHARSHHMLALLPAETLLPQLKASSHVKAS
jgi:hypothetical protein